MAGFGCGLWAIMIIMMSTSYHDHHRGSGMLKMAGTMNCE
jgi:hypothetical protein